MPTIRLKPNSAEFENGPSSHKNTAPCDMPACPSMGEHKAPRDHSLQDHYYFCKTHIQQYNRAWNFFEGMNPAEVEEHIIRAFYGDRPTWKYREFSTFEDELYTKVNQTRESAYTHQQFHEAKEQTQKSRRLLDIDSPHIEALSIMGLEPPITLEEIKKEYKILAKRYHPDHNRNDPEAEEVLKCINMAYTLLKVAYGKYENITSE